MCFTAVADIAAQRCNLPAPGIVKVKLTNADWIDAFPALDDYPTTGDPNTISGDITLDTVTYTDAAWGLITLTPKRNRMDQEQQDNDGLKSYQSTFVGVLVGHDATIEYWLNQYSKSGVIVAVPDKAGNEKIMGNPTNPAELIWKHELGEASGSFVGYEITITWDAHGEPMPFYTGAAL